MGWKVSPILRQIHEEQKKTHTKWDYENDWYWENDKLVFRARKPRRNSGKKNKSVSFNHIHTIGYYGSKRRWRNEFAIILAYVQRFHCNRFIDCFGGSGVISLLAAENGAFDYIQLNDVFYELINYHNVMKDEQAFKQFIFYLDKLSRCDEDYFIEKLKIYKSNVKENTKRVQFRKIIKSSAENAALYYCVKHHEYSNQGSIVKKRKLVADYIPTLKRTHELYKNITITQYHYKKVLIKNLKDISTFILMDCPYLPQVRKQSKSYNFEMSYGQHIRMLEELTKGVLGAKVAVCGYDNEVYNNYFLRCNRKYNTSWHCVRIRQAGDLEDGAEGKETLWFNFGVIQLVEENPTLFELVY